MKIASETIEPRRPSFVSLTNMSCYSLFEAVSAPEEIVGAAARERMLAVGLADAGTLAGALRFYDSALASGIKPIIGMCAFVAAQGRLIRSHENRRFRLNLLAVNEDGLKSLLALFLAGWYEGYYFRPRIDKEILEQHRNGLIVLSGDAGGEIPWLISNGKREEAMSVALWYQQCFSNEFFLEIQDHGCKIEKMLNPQIVELGQKLKIPVVATNGSRYIHQNDASRLDMALAKYCDSDLDDPHRFRMETNEYYFNSAQDMAEHYALFPGVIGQSKLISDRCMIPSRSSVVQINDACNELLAQLNKYKSSLIKR